MRFLLFVLILTHGICNAQSTANTLIDSLSQVDNPQKKVSLCLRIADQLQVDDWKRALTYLETAENEASTLSNADSTLAIIYNRISDHYSLKDVIDVSLDYRLKAYKIYKSKSDLDDIAITENNLAIIYASLKSREKALHYFKRVYHYQLSQKDTFQLAKILNNIGTVFIEVDLDSSLIYYYKALNFSNGIKDDVLAGYIYTNLGRTHSLLQSKDVAAAYFESARQIAVRTDNNELKSFIFASIATYYLETERHDSSIVYALKTMEINQSNYYSFSNLNATKYLYQAYNSLGDYQTSVYYFKKYDAIRDSLNIEEKLINVERLKLKQEYETKEQLQRIEAEKQRFKYIIIGLGLIGAILIMLLVLLRYRNKIHKDKLEKELLEAKQKELYRNLENKNKVLISKAMSEMHRNDIINNILTELKKTKLNAGKEETRDAIEHIIGNLQRDINTNLWEEFEVSFDQVHESFCKALNISHPDLTPKERRLSSLLYLDLSSKEISLITGQSYKAVENARTRLRKKLKLTNEKVNISSYLNNLK